MRLLRCFSTLLFAAFTLVLNAQDPWLKPAFSAQPTELLAAAAKVEAKDADVVVLFDDNVFRFDDQGRATRTYRFVFKVLTPQGAEDWASVSAHYEPWRENKPVIKARVINKDGSVHTLDTNTLADAPARDESPNIFTDDRILQGPLPAIAAGSVVEQETSIVESQSMLALGQIYRVRFGASEPVLNSRVLIDYPSALPLRHSVRLLPAAIQDRRESAGRTVITITHGRMEALEVAESFAPGSVTPYPTIELSTGSSWKALAQEYGRILDEKIKDADLKSFVEKAKAGADRTAVIASLVRQLHDQVRYTGVEFGESSIIPQPPSETLKRKYGDCKDKSALLVAMLRAAGIPAHLALLSTGPGEDSSPDLPGLGRFDHAIVYIPGPPALWIDATADYSRLEQFPADDQGRLALVVAAESDRLVLTPELPASANRLVEIRDVYLSENGPARFVETTEVHGIAESAYRSYYQGGDQKERRKGLESYVKDEYASDRLVRFETSGIRDFSTPFKLTLEAAEARRGYTSINNAELYVVIYNILNRMPKDLMQDADEEKDQEDKSISERAKKKRQNEFVFSAPFVTEWQYRVHAPAGFAVRVVPEDSVYKFGPALLTSRFAREVKDGVLLSSFVLDSGKRHWSAADVEEFREALKKWKQISNPQIAFTLKSSMLLAAGKVKEGMAELKTLASLHPKEAIHHVQLSSALLDAGLGEGARAEARLATQLEPASAEAHQHLGWVMQHDLVGRRFRRGFDLAAARAAYRKTLELDSKNNEARMDYAILLEHNSSGTRYGAGADLEEALQQYIAIGDKISEYRGVDNPLYLRLRMGKYQELIAELGKMSRTENRVALLIAATAALQGRDAALVEGNKIQAQDGSRLRVMSSASQLLVNIRRYPEASAVLAAGVEGTEKAATEAGRARLLAGIAPFDTDKADRNDPGGFVKLMFGSLMNENEISDQTVEAFSSPATISSDPKVRQKDLKRSRESIQSARASFRRNGIELPVLRDIMLTLAQTSAEFDGLNTYRVRMTMPGSQPLVFYATRIGQKLYGTGGSNEFEGLGHELLRRAAAGEVEPSRKMLDWLREEVKIVGGEDPLAGPVLPHLWTRGQTATPDDLRLIGAVLITTAQRNTAPAITPLEQTLAKGVPDAQKSFVQLALAQAYAKDERYKEALPLLAVLRKSYPDSLTAFTLSATAFLANGDFASWETMVTERLQRLPNDPDAIRSLSSLYAARNQGRKAIAELVRVVDLGKAGVGDFNMLSWQELFDSNVTAKGLEYGQQGNLLGKSQDAPILHTLAAVYAEVGKISEAREMILKAMDQWGLDEPNSACWYVFGRIAEQYGMNEDAIAAYKKVDRPDFDWQLPSSTYRLAARQLAALQKAAPSVKAAK